MFKQDAINFFGSGVKVAAAAGVDPSAVSQWKTLVPEGRAHRLEVASNGVLHYDPAIYDQYKQNRTRDLSNENQPTD